MKKIFIDLKERSYSIMICYNKLARIARFIKPLRLGTDAVIITNPKVNRLFGGTIKDSFASNGFNIRFEIVPDTEKAKSAKYCFKLLTNISEFDASGRRIFIVALGGGVVGDLAGFVASVYRRGVPYIQVPTTLLGQVDSAIGGKVAIDLTAGKNLAGSFYQPRLVFSDIALIKTLPQNDFISGLAEVIKYGIIRSPHLFRFLEQNYVKILRRDKKTLLDIVYLCSSIKAEIVEKDELDNKDIRAALNLGHTVGHAIESAAHYKLYSHGHAIALGILSASLISHRIGLLSKKDYTRIKGLIEKMGLPTIIKGVDIKSILSAQEHDKKFIHGKNRFVFPVKIGKVVLKEGIPKALIRDAIASLK